MTSATIRGGMSWATVAAMAILALAGAVKAEGIADLGNSKAAKLDQCVEPTAYMRRNHMELIEHQRDKTVHQGIRSTKYSLAGCIDCHVEYDAGQQPIPVDAEAQFCDSCHDFVGVKPDCFGCHSTVPRSSATGSGAALNSGDAGGTARIPAWRVVRGVGLAAGLPVTTRGFPHGKGD